MRANHVFFGGQTWNCFLSVDAENLRGVAWWERDRAPWLDLQRLHQTQGLIEGETRDVRSGVSWTGEIRSTQRTSSFESRQPRYFYQHVP